MIAVSAISDFDCFLRSASSAVAASWRDRDRRRDGLSWAGLTFRARRQGRARLWRATARKPGQSLGAHRVVRAHRRAARPSGRFGCSGTMASCSAKRARGGCRHWRDHRRPKSRRPTRPQPPHLGPGVAELSSRRLVRQVGRRRCPRWAAAGGCRTRLVSRRSS